MTKRESRVIDAFIRCVESGEFTITYAIILIEDNQRYGWLSEAAKDRFYDFIDALEEQQNVEINDDDIGDEMTE